MPLNKARRDLITTLKQNEQLKAENGRLEDEVQRLEHALSTTEMLAVRATEVALPGNPWHEELAAREREVLMRLMEGDTSAQIAAVLFISESTVKSHVAQIFIKLHVHNRAGAVTAAGRLGIVKPEDEPTEGTTQ